MLLRRPLRFFPHTGVIRQPLTSSHHTRQPDIRHIQVRRVRKQTSRLEPKVPSLQVFKSETQKELLVQ